MITHLTKHLIQGLFLLSALWASSRVDLPISQIGVAVLVVVGLAMLEIGLRVLERRSTRRAATT